jgi:ATP-binding cassette, subfamily A (ABC1), member 3
LDEAEVLSDRIGIMAKGKLLAVGTTDFIKKNFGVGYHLKVMEESV